MPTIEITGDESKIRRVYEMLVTDKVAIFQVETEEKYAKILAQNDVKLVMQGVELHFKDLPFKPGRLVYGIGRHDMQVIIYSQEVEEATWKQIR